ncbi:proteinase-activated receptor 1 [Megalops cyprinoides]|uniref:proteinase-activated receptor 1 n=1 Tax=Megalops cyprinoides TaxID=118141 RepID=UPI001864D52F|nr:proteinase-activated receptor 1 [Megalops cyprinoides]
MFFKAVVVLTLLGLYTAAAIPFNGSVRTFSGFFLTVTDEPIEFLDVQEGSASGFSSESTRERKPPVTKKHYYISKEASQFLTGSLVTAFIPSVYVLVFIISVPLNGAAVFMFVRKIRPKKPAAIYMLNLAVADLLFVLLLPFKMSYHFNGNNWVFGSWTCRLVTSAFYCNMYCSILLMMCISVDRFLAVVYPMESLSWRSQQNAMAACGAMWLLSVAGVMPIFLSEQTIRLPELGITTCHDVLDVEQQRGYYLYFFPIFCAVFFFIPLIFTTVCYLRIIQALGAAGMSDPSKRSRAVFMAATVLAVFVVCFTPTNVILLAHYVQFAHHHSDGSYAAYLLSMCIGTVSCCLDPLLYYFGSSQCRKQVAGFLRCQATPALERSTQSSSTRTSKMETFQSNLSSQYKKLVA